MPDEQPVVWPEDPLEADARAADAEPDATPVPSPAPAPPSSWPTTFEEALKESQAAQGAAAPAETPVSAAVEPGGHEYPTQHAMPPVPAKTLPPAARTQEAAKTVPPAANPKIAIAAISSAEDPPTATFKTQPPLPVPGAPIPNGEEPAHADADGVAPAAPEENPLEAEGQTEAQTEAAAEPVVAQAAEASAEEGPQPDLEAEAEPAAAAAVETTMGMGPASTTDSEALPSAAVQATVVPEPLAQPEPGLEPAEAAAPEPEPVVAAGQAAEPVAEAPAPQPEPAEEEWIPAPVNPPVPTWAPKLAPEPVAENVQWPGSNLPSWAPIGGGRSTSNMQAAQRSAPRPSIPVGEALPQGKPASQPPAAAAQPAATIQPGSTPGQPGSSPGPASGSKSKTTSSWEVVAQKPNEAPKQEWAGPTGEDRSYAEWFAWAKRSGAPAPACHAAAQGAFRALAAGQDMNTAVQWATLAMASPPGLVGPSRQLYCAWFSLGNIDLKLPSPQAHAFATGAIKALDAGADAPSAHQAGLAAAGITGT